MELNENEELLYVPVCCQGTARYFNAKFKRKSFTNNTKGYFFIPSDINEEQYNILSTTYGKNSYKAKEKEKEILETWKKVIQTQENFDCLRMAKQYGFPKDEKIMESLFLKLKKRGNGDYPISWEHLREYLPEFDNDFGVDRYLELHRKYNLQGDMSQAIRTSNMPNIDKYFLYFVYEISD